MGSKAKAQTEVSQPASKDSVKVKVNVHPNWQALIIYCGMAHENGMLCFATEASIPVEMLNPGTREKILFGKSSPKPLFIKDKDAANVTVIVTKKWEGLIKFCHDSFPYGQVCIQMAAGEPKTPVGKYTKAKIRFDHPESFPKLVRFYDNS
jgi:hypothetical protein